MPYKKTPGQPFLLGGAGLLSFVSPGNNGVIMDAAGEAFHITGYFFWEDGGTHSIESGGSVGSSAFVFQLTTATFANAGTTFKVGMAATDLTNGPPARAVNNGGSPNVVTFDVECSMTGGTSALTASQSNSKAPTSGSKTIASGDLVTMAFQMTARGGSDTITVVAGAQTFGGATILPATTTYLASTYSGPGYTPTALMVIASDGTKGTFLGMCPSAASGEAFGSGATPDERGNIFSLPTPMSITGIQAYIDPDNPFDVVLYSDPLGTPSALVTVSVDPNAVNSAAGGMMFIGMPQQNWQQILRMQS